MSRYVCTACEHKFSSDSDDFRPEGCPSCSSLEIVDARTAERQDFDARMCGEYALDLFD